MAEGARQASGSVEAMVGMYFKWEVQGTTEIVTLTGYYRMTGAIGVLGLITVTVRFYLGLSY